MKALPWILVVLLLIACVAAWFRPVEYSPADVLRDTVTITDTVRDTVPQPYRVEVIRNDTLWFPFLADGDIEDSDVRDSFPVVLPVERKEYRTEEYRAIVSGFRPNLDFMETYNRMQTITVTPKAKRWGLGLQVGYGYPGGFYVGAGVNYNLWQW